MFAKGEWVVPTINGDVYTDKPILYFWLVLVGSMLFGGVNEWTVRLPSALSGFGLALTTYFLGRDLFSPRVGFMAALVLSTSARVLWEARWAHTDMAFTFFFTLSMVFFVRSIFKIGRPGELLLAYASAGLATLTKGLIGVVLPGLVLFTFVAVRRDWRALLKWRLASGILVFLLVAAPWFASVSLATEGEWLKVFLFTHHLQRYTSGLGHRQPFYYYFINLPADFLPWTIFAVPAIFSCRSRIKALLEPIYLLLFLWFALIFLFFSFSDTKRALYLLPVFPPVALFVARYFDHLIRGEVRQDALYRWMAYFFFNIVWIGSLSLPVGAWFFRREVFVLSLPFALLLAGGGLATVVSISRKLPQVVFLTTAVTLFLGMLYTAVGILPFVDRYKSPKPFALKVKGLLPPAEPLYIYADTMNDFNFYMEREVIPLLSSEAEVEHMAAQAQTAYLLIRDRDLKKLRLGEKAAIVAEGRVGDKKWHLLQLTDRQ
jgi:4-amino-4-deoxy-L-arabinose transferase-like glycosyltransferase